MEVKKDKLEHFLAGFFLSLLGFFYLPLGAAGFVYGVGKEIWDLSTGLGVFDLWDMVATFTGAAMGLMVVLSF